MIEFLTENSRRAYPLEELPPGFDANSKWAHAFLDACIGYTGILKEGERIRLLGMRRTTTAPVTVQVKIGISAADNFVVNVKSGLDNFATVSKVTANYIAFLTVNGPVLDSLLPDLPYATGVWMSFDIPFALRCTNSAIKRVTAVSAYSPTICETPWFYEEERTPVRVIEAPNPVIFGSKDGIDVDTTTLNTTDNTVMRISAVIAPADTSESDTNVNMMIRGDDCFTVEAIPGVVASEDGALVPLTDKSANGVIRIGTKCKPCCQCEDYKNSVDSLRPSEQSTLDMQTRLDNLVLEYNTVVAMLEDFKTQAKATINSYDYVHVKTSSVASGGVYSGSHVSGTRNRIAVSVNVENMTLERADISNMTVTIPGFTFVKAYWNMAGSVSRSGNTLTGVTWYLQPGDTISAVVVASKTATQNELDAKPTMTVELDAKIPSRDSKHYKETVS